jgi:phosphatidylglycerophosphate synthase
MPRLISISAAAVTVAAGLGVRAFFDGAFADHAGDALYTVLLYWLAVLVRPAARPWAAALTACGLSWAIEFAQLLSIPAVLRPVLGSTFNPADLLWYAAGALLAALVHSLLSRRDDGRETPL